MTPKIERWIEWWQGTFDPKTSISKVVKPQGGSAWYIILPITKHEDGRLEALEGLMVDDQEFVGDPVEYLVGKKADYDATHSYGSLAPGAKLLTSKTVLKDA